MRSARNNFVPITSLLLVSAAAVAVMVDAARAQDVPVTYRTDPAAGSDGPQVLSFRAEDAPAPTGDVYHTVQTGETVYALARAYQVPPANIINANGLSAPYGLQIGQEVLIPMNPQPQVPAQVQTVAAGPRPGAQPQEVRSEAVNRGTVYLVEPGDTLFSLSRRFGVSVAELANANSLRHPYALSINQRLVIPSSRGSAAAPRPQQSVEVRRSPSSRELTAKVAEETMLPRQLPEMAAEGRFTWPLRGTVLVDFGAKNGNEVSQGINIAAPIGAPVRATADGEVVYRGSELNGYGNLLLVKHEEGWVSAYAHNDAILVRKGDFVRQGQVIAKVGRSGSVDRPQLHFQLRKDLQPQDPIIAMQGDTRGEGLTAASLR